MKSKLKSLYTPIAFYYLISAVSIVILGFSAMPLIAILTGILITMLAIGILLKKKIALIITTIFSVIGLLWSIYGIIGLRDTVSIVFLITNLYCVWVLIIRRKVVA